MDKRGLLDLIIARLPLVSAKEKICLAGAFDNEEDFCVNSKGDFEHILGRALKAFWDTGAIRARAERDADICRIRGIRWVSLVSPAYPPLLRETYDPPATLFFRGRLPDPEKPLLAMVGTRRPGPAASAQAYRIARDLGRSGVSVVSGLALGIDAFSHQGNLAGGAPTFAVLGTGADEIYPRSNRALAMRIVETGGLLSEYPPGTGPRRWNFPARNRIISALARSALIVEAPERSGALITARFALEQGRELWVASDGASSAGAAKLAEDGAGIISCAADILAEWNIEFVSGDIVAHNEGVLEYGDGRAVAASLAAKAAAEMDQPVREKWR